MSTYHNIVDKSIDKHYAQICTELTNSEFIHFHLIFNIVSNTFKLELPATNLPYFRIAENLIFNNQIAVFDDGTKVGCCTGSGSLLNNGFYSSYMITLRNGEQFIRDFKDIEVCRLNSFEFPYIFHIVELSKALSNAYLSTANATERSMIPPIIIASDDTQVASILDMYSEKLNFSPFRITKNEAFANGEIQKVDLFTSTNYDLNMFWDNYTKLKNLIMNMFGVPSVDIQKRERLTTEEAVTSSQDSSFMFGEDIKRNLTDFKTRCDNRGWECKLYLFERGFSDEHTDHTDTEPEN